MKPGGEGWGGDSGRSGEMTNNKYYLFSLCLEHVTLKIMAVASI